VWVRGSAAPVVARLVRANVPVSQESSSSTIASSSAFLALSWTFGFMKGVGALIGLVAVVALLLYLQGRQRSREVSYSLARRMGLRSTVHGASLLLELAGLLVIALGIGAGLALVAARLTFTRLDPLPKLAPQIWMQVPTGALLLAAALLAAGALVGSILAQRRASRTNVAEVLRVAV
jgi:ABC-type antimicrobial peptide transport system permease subunit